MAINFSDKVMITNPTAYHIGRAVACIGIIAIVLGIVTHFTGDLLLPASAWPAVGVPACVIGGIFIRSGLTRS